MNTPQTEHPALCPECGQLATRETNWTTAGVTEAAYLCPEKHAWTSKWQAPKEAA